MVSAGHSVISGHPHSRYGVDPLPKAFKLEPKLKMIFSHTVLAKINVTSILLGQSAPKSPHKM